jgi:hypothetical protein
MIQEEHSFRVVEPCAIYTDPDADQAFSKLLDPDPDPEFQR